MTIKAGDRIMLRDETQPLTVKAVINHPNFKIGPETFVVQRLYFVEDHQPEFDWRVNKVMESKNDK